MEEKRIIFRGDLFEVISTVFVSKNTNKIRVFEKAHRPPGVRMLFTKNNNILISREFRSELNEWDYRLPGGKVFDEFASYSKYFEDPIGLERKIRESVVVESKQEVGLIVTTDRMNLLYKSVAGASVVWDLYYFEITEFEISDTGQELEEGENIGKPIWVNFKELKEMCLSGKINEDRTVAVLLRYILNKNIV